MEESLSEAFTIVVSYENIEVPIEPSAEFYVFLCLCLLLLFFNILLIISCISFINGDLIQPLRDLNQRMIEIMDNEGEEIELAEGQKKKKPAQIELVSSS